MTSITFAQNLKEYILKVFDKTVDSDGFVTEKNSGYRVLSHDGQEMTLGEFGGIKKGSEIFVRDDIASLITFYDKYLKKSA